ncbi:hypothetical protein N431DRAFT_450460 [Stipitochalara longipes BDJ]|nr:hypothetical protein N431DRAFT_450460 [Stipitochalara longipes BDJ]
MSSNTGSYVISSQDSKGWPSPYAPPVPSTSPTYTGPQTASTTPQPSYLQQPQIIQGQLTQPLPYNQPTGAIPQFSPSVPQSQDYPPSYAPSPTPYPNMQGGVPSVSQQPTSEPNPVAQKEKKPVFTPETKEKTKALCAECGSSAKWACGATLLITGLLDLSCWMAMLVLLLNILERVFIISYTVLVLFLLWAIDRTSTRRLRIKSRSAKKASNRLQKSPSEATTRIFEPSMTELCRVAESRVHTAIKINRQALAEFETEVRKERRNLWRVRATTTGDIRVSILSIILDFLAGDRKNNQALGSSIKELALRQLDRDMISDNQCEGAWERLYKQKHARLVKDGREDSEEAEKLMIMIETLNVYRAQGVFKNNEYSPSKAKGSDGRDKREWFFGTEIS